jgi:carnosine N-methyltransferase
VANSHTIHPFLHSFSNHLSTANLLRAVPIPDTCPRDVLGSGEGGAFSLVAGDFEEIYGVALEEGESGSRGMEGDNDDDAMSNNQHGHATQRGQWGAVVTCFFIDCVRTIHLLDLYGYMV